MKKLSTLFLLMAITSWIACNQSQKNETTNPETEHASEADHHDDHGSGDALMLDHGKKWQIDEATRMHVGNIEKAIQDPASGTGDMEFYQSLAGFLKENIAKLTADCTMTGEAHDELHKWLYTFIETSKELAAATDGKKADETAIKLKASIEEFHQFFE
jgi:major membrane immunogen (membrane-anchored lipoprotein)